MVLKVPCLLLQARMMKALIQGLPKGFVYGCAQGTLVGVEAGFSHTVADMTCAQVSGGGLVRFSKLFSHALVANALPDRKCLCWSMCLSVQHFSTANRPVDALCPVQSCCIGCAILLHRQHACCHTCRWVP